MSADTPLPPSSGSPKERPILFSGPMVRAIIDGRKTQTRRVMKAIRGERGNLNPAYLDQHCDPARAGHEAQKNREAAAEMWCPYGKPGDRLWVRETWSAPDGCECSETCHVRGHVYYDADDSGYENARFNRRRPLIHMPRWASRLTLEITNVRVERLQDISEADASEEGVETDVWDQALVARKYDEPDAWFQMWSEDMAHYVDLECIHRASYRTLWDSLNAKRGFGWDMNPWVWVLEFRVLPQETSHV